MTDRLKITSRRRKKNPKKLLLILALGLALIGAAALTTNHYWHKAAPNKSSVPFLTAAQFQSESANLSNLMKQQGIESAFNYVESKIATDPSFAKDCHPLLHTLGHAAYAYYGGYSQAIKYQNEICDSGYTHGVIEAYLDNTPNIQQALESACSSTTVENFDQWQCYHGLGHGVMLVSLENIKKSISLCNTFPSSFSQDACVNGVFMQHFVVTDHDGSIPATNPTSLSDCKYQDVLYQTDCYYYAPSAYLTINDGQYASALKWCNGAETDYIAICVSGVGSETMKENIHDPDLTKKVCLEANKKYVTSCISGAISMNIFFYASSSSAESLCKVQFKNFPSSCRTAISDTKNTLKIQ